MPRLACRVFIVVSVTAVCSLACAASSMASGGPHGAAARQQAFRALLAGHAGGARQALDGSPVNSIPDDNDEADEAGQYGDERTAPATTVSGEALLNADQQAAALSVSGGLWQDITTKPFQAAPSDYVDPFWSNVGSGFSLVGGRTTALAQTPDGDWYAGTADGGVWRSTSQGSSWTPISDHLASLSIGALAVDPVDGSLWVGTGEANSNADSYAGTGIYRLVGSSYFAIVGGPAAFNPLASRTVFQISFDPQGNAYAATNNGLFRYAVDTGRWIEVLDPAGAVAPTPYDNQVTSVAVVPGSGGEDVIAAVGWRGAASAADPSEGLENNGFYESTDGGQTFQEVTPGGAVDASDIGRTTFAYSADGDKLYAIVESPSELAAGDETSLQGIFVTTGSPANVAGPWTKIGDEATLAASGSALPVGSGYGVGIQSWYNQTLIVDPNDDDHVYAGLEEVFETTNGGKSWVTASPYWNYGLPCAAACPNTTHPDQHALMISDGKIVIGNDGGVYSRPLADTQQYGDWNDLNATLEDLQYYDARAGALPATTGPSGGLFGAPTPVGVWGGLQDNGTSVLNQGSSEMDEPAGGDGFYVIVDPADSDRMVGEYADGTMYSSTDGGHSFADYVSPGCDAQETVGLAPLPDCDPSMRFGTPLVPDQSNPDVWVTGGEDVWVSTAGWATSCTSTTACSWQDVYDTGPNNAVTALSSTGGGRVIYAAWVAGGGNPGPQFASGIATNFGGTWHEVNTAGLPDRYISGVTVDPLDPAHAYAVFNGFSRRWIPGGGVGHVYETYNGGLTWRNISANLPDVAADALVKLHGTLVLGTDLGVYAARAYQGTATHWARFGYGLPNASVNDVTIGPNGFVYAATHGRGIWRLRVPGL